MSDGYSINWDWSITKNDAGYKVDFLQPKPDQSLYDCVDYYLSQKLEGSEFFSDTRNQPDLTMDLDTREKLITKWGAYFDIEFYKRNGPPLNIDWRGGLNFDSPFNQVDGYGNAGEQIVRSLIIKKVKVFIADTWKVQNDKTNLSATVTSLMDKGFDETHYPVGIRFSQPNSFQSTPGKFKVGWSMWEFPQFPTDWKNGANSVNINFVPCGWNRLLWEKGGVTKPTVTVPLGIPEDSFRYIERNHEGQPFTFITDGSILGESNLVQLYKNVFGDSKNVRMIMKTLPREKRETIVNGNLTEIRGRLTHQELLDWYGSGDCFVYPTPAEGFGLFPLEAMATGLPVIMTDLPAMKTFCWPGLCYPIPVKKVDWYHFPDTDALMEQMQYCFHTKREELVSMGKRASRFVHQNLTYRHTAEKILSLLER